MISILKNLISGNIISSPGRSPGRAIVLPQASALASVAASAASALAKCLSFNVKVFYVMGKALPGELSCPCDRSCFSIQYVIFVKARVENETTLFSPQSRP